MDERVSKHNEGCRSAVLRISISILIHEKIVMLRSAPTVSNRLATHDALAHQPHKMFPNGRTGDPQRFGKFGYRRTAFFREDRRHLAVAIRRFHDGRFRFSLGGIKRCLRSQNER